MTTGRTDDIGRFNVSTTPCPGSHDLHAANLPDATARGQDIGSGIGSGIDGACRHGSLIDRDEREPPV